MSFQKSPLILLAVSAIILAFCSGIPTCNDSGPGYFKFLSKTQTRLTPATIQTFKGHCFNKISVTLTSTSHSFEVAIVASEIRDSVALCIDLILVSTGKTTKPVLLRKEGDTGVSIPFQKLSTNEKKFVETDGLHILRMCDNFTNTWKNVMMTAKLLVGGWGKSRFLPVFGTHIPKFQVNANLEFIAQFTGHKWHMRKKNKFVRLRAKDVSSGDILVATRFDGIDGFGEVNAGSRAGHVAMIIKRGKQVWVVESKKSGITKQGVYKLTWKQWMKENWIQDTNVILLPLKPDLRKKFDAEKAWAAFEKLEGNDYGFRNYLFSQIDTENQNSVEILDLVFLGILFSTLEPFFGFAFAAAFYEAWSQRLGSDRILNMDEIWERLYVNKMTLGQLSAIPEVEGHKYSNGVNYVCSAFVVYLFRAGGLLEGVDVHATEFTPRDVYELNFYDIGGGAVPKRCKKYAPHGYCQIMGRADFDLGKANYVAPYSHMNERCPTIPPQFVRPEGC